MQIIITGGAGFLGQLLATELVASSIEFDELILVDIIIPKIPANSNNIRAIKQDISDIGVAQSLISENTSVIFHLAAIVSSHAELDFDLGWKVNVDGTNNLLEACRQQSQKIKFVFASSCAVFGGKLPNLVNDQTALTPGSSYGAQKAICELLVNDYSRKGFIDGISLRLPTVCIRPGKPNLAASSFVSSIIREPLNGQVAICPVPKSLSVWISSPFTIIKNFIFASQLPTITLQSWRTVNLPGIKITVNEMIQTLESMNGTNIINLIKFEENEAISKIVNTWPTEIDNSNALNLGFQVDEKFSDFIQQYLNQNK